MAPKSSVIVSLCALMLVVGCAKAGRSLSSPPPPQVTAFAGSPQRFLAVRHTLEVVASESGLPEAWESVITFCATIQCEVISSSITTKTQYSAASGNLFLRVAPEDLKKLFVHLEKQGSIVRHTTETADKTAVVVDVDARIKNLISFRDNLRAMVAKSSVSIKDLVEIQQQLTDVQSQLDSQATQRKILANETEKVAVEIAFRAERSVGSSSVFAPIGDALRESGSALAESIASLITFLVTAIPWLILVVPVYWLSAKLWRKLRRKRIELDSTLQFRRHLDSFVNDRTQRRTEVQRLHNNTVAKRGGREGLNLSLQRD